MRIFSLEAARLVDELKAAGITCRAEAGDLVCQSHFQLPTELRQRIKASKPELLKLLEAGEGNWKPEAKWDFQIIHVGADHWMMGSRLDKPGCHVCWFVREPRVQ